MRTPRLVAVDAADPYERGCQRGRQVGDRLARTWPTYQLLFEIAAAEHGRAPVDVAGFADATTEAVASWAPELLRELEGVSATAEVPLSTVVALNARTEIFAAARGDLATECSTVACLPPHSTTAWSAQTWDWHGELADGWHGHEVRGTSRAYAGLAEYGMLAKIGVNDAGLGLHLNLLRHAEDGEADSAAAGVPVHLVAAKVLAEAESVQDVVDLARSVRFGASTVLTVVTADDAACVELSPAGVGVVRPVDGWLVHANHFLDSELAEGEAVTESVTTTFERQDLLERRAKDAGRSPAPDLLAMLAAHDEDGAAVCRHPAPEAAHGYRTETLATIQLRPAERTARIAAGGPCGGGPVQALRVGAAH